MKIIHWPTFLITLIICTIFFLIFIILRLKSITDDVFPLKSKRRFIGHAKTGDILSVAYSAKRAKLVNVFTGSVWAHSALVIKAPNRKPYVIEVAHYSREKSGLIATKLKKWLRKNKHFVVAYRPYRGKGIELNDTEKFIDINKNAKMDMFVVSWLKSMYKTSFGDENKSKHKKRYYCSEFITHFLQETGVFYKKYKPAGYKPWELLYGRLPLLEAQYYGEPKILE